MSKYIPETVNYPEQTPESIPNIKEEVKVFKNQLGDKVLGAIKKMFADNPELTAIYWTQYTPYFNDGEACYFHVGEALFSTSTEPKTIDQISRWGEDDKFFKYDSSHDKYYDQWRKIRDDDAFLAAFDDHARVFCTRTQIQIDELEHD